MVACAIILRDPHFRVRIDDSKRLTESQRCRAFEVIVQKAWVGIGKVGPGLIDRINILRASALAMAQAIRNIGFDPDFLLIDGNVPVPTLHARECLVHGESRSLSIACASIVAKVTRDRLMSEYDRTFPEYGFCRHKGYPTPEHLAALEKYGPSPIHRKSFRPVSQLHPGFYADID